MRKGSYSVYFWVTEQDPFYAFTHGSAQVKLKCLVTVAKIKNTSFLLENSVEILLCAGNILVLLELPDV